MPILYVILVISSACRKYPFVNHETHASAFRVQRSPWDECHTGRKLLFTSFKLCQDSTGAQSIFR